MTKSLRTTMIAYLLLLSNNCLAQWSKPPKPLVDTLDYTITDTVYLSVSGNDSNSGTRNLPVATFDKAVKLLPFDSVHNFGLVVILPGHYYPKTKFQQNMVDWQKQFSGVTHYKNISVLGEGEVVIYGDSIQNPNQGHPLLGLKGSHIFVKNLELKNSPGMGLAFTLPYEPFYQSYDEIYEERSQHVIIDGVKVDGAVGHGLFAKFIDVVLIQNCDVSKTSGNYQFKGQKNWGGAIKFDFASNVICRNNYVHNNYGEGINLSLSYNSHTHDNKLHDNRASHIYSMNARRAIINNNLTYTTVFDSTYWTPNTPARAATGIAIRNEFEWGDGWKIGYRNGTHPCIYTFLLEMEGQSMRKFDIVDPFSLCGTHPKERWPSETDSIFVYNNVLLNAGMAIAINDASTLGMAYLNGERSLFKNLFIHHNTCFGWSGEDVSKTRMLSIYQNASNAFGPVSIAQNIKVQDNVFLLSDRDTTYINRFAASHPQAYTFGNNIWNASPENGNEDGDSNTFAEDTIVTYFPKIVSPDSLSVLNPTQHRSLRVLSEFKPTYLTFDFEHFRRDVKTNVGALEARDPGSIFLESQDARPKVYIYPNPAKNTLFVLTDQVVQRAYIQDVGGKIVREFHLSNEFDIHELQGGMYYVVVLTGEGHSIHKLVIGGK